MRNSMVLLSRIVFDAPGLFRRRAKLCPIANGSGGAIYYNGGNAGIATSNPYLPPMNADKRR